MLSEEIISVLINLGLAWLGGGLIGLERTYHGRPAGFRTHALVCVASALLMLISTHQTEWINGMLPQSAIQTDPTRMAQGIMTGIGFLGAGVIFKEGLTVHGLTTAASIWITSALGILFGIGFLYPAVIVTMITLITLSLFRWVENLIPSEFYADHVISYPIESVDDESEVRERITRHGCVIKSMSYQLIERGTIYCYDMVLQTHDKDNLVRLAAHLRESRTILEFRLSTS